MDDLGNILYILVAIAVVIFNIIKKGKQASASTPPPVEKNDPFEDMIPKFEQLFKPDSEVKTSSSSFPQKKERKDVKVKPQPVLNDFEEKRKQVQSRVHTIPKKETTKEPIQVLTDSAPNWFNAREAIIYSEILKRPEF
jgi:hypothetical protein